MAEIFYADATVVRVGSEFATEFRFLRQAIVSPVLIYLQVGPTLRHGGGNNDVKNWAYRCGPYTFRTAGSVSYPSNTATAVSL